MEPRSRETTPSKDDLDFIVDDGNKHDEDPDYVGISDRRDKYLARATKIKNKQGELTHNNPESANYWSTKLLW